MRLKQKLKKCSRVKHSGKKPLFRYSFLSVGVFLLFFVLHVDASQIGFRLYAGGSWIQGGDLNTHLEDWGNLLQDRSSDENYSLIHKLGRINWLKEGSAEIFYSFSSRFSVALAFGFISGSQSGVIDSNFSQEQDYFHSPSDFGKVFIEEQSYQEPVYKLRSYPVSLILYYSFKAGDNWDFFIGGGASYYSGTLVYEENYVYDFEYTEENAASSSMFQFNDQYTTNGLYAEEFKSSTFGALIKCGIDYRLKKGLSVVAEVQGRWAELTDWKGTKNDEYSWNHTWGFAGENLDSGSSAETGEGILWLGDYQSDETQKSYSRFVFSEEKPGEPILNAEPAKINLSGISFRIGLKISL